MRFTTIEEVRDNRRSAVVKGFDHISTNFMLISEWRGFESHWFYQSRFEFAKTPLLILNHVAVGLVVR